jgi:hypothetical protein
MNSYLLGIQIVAYFLFLIRYGYCYAHKMNIVRQKIFFLNKKLQQTKVIEDYSTNFMILKLILILKVMTY